MSAMTQTAISECSFPDSEVDNLDDSIDRTCSKLRTAMEEVVLLRKQLRELVSTKKQNAIQQLSKAKQYLESVEKQERELGEVFGEDERNSSSASYLAEEGHTTSPLKAAIDSLDQSPDSPTHRQDIGFEAPPVALEGQYLNSEPINTNQDAASKGDTMDATTTVKSEKGEGSDPLPLLEDLPSLEQLDNVTLANNIDNYRMQMDIWKEEIRRREEARALAMVAEADKELSALKVERESIQARSMTIATLERELQIWREEGIRLASAGSPPPHTKAAATKKKKGSLNAVKMSPA